MTYIIAEPCIDIKDRSCVDVCPVDCIHEAGRMLVIDPEECIDYGACEPECPVEAIFPEDALPEKWEPFVKINYVFPEGIDKVDPLVDAYASPVPVPPPPLIVGAESRPGVELAARVGDGWTTPAATLAERLPHYLDALVAVGKARPAQRVLVAFDLPRSASLAGSPWVEDPAGAATRWASAGADGAVLGANTPADVDLLVAAAQR